LTTTNSAAEQPVAKPRGAAKAPAPRTSEFSRQLAIWGRWLHIYLSMVSFAILFFFAVTGLTLNHPDWFGEHQQTSQFKGSLQPAWLTGKEVAKLEIVEYLRRTNGVKGFVADFRVDDAQCSVSFKGPGYSADAFIDRQSGKYELNETRLGLVAVLNDLHKGRDSGPKWSLVVDFSAVLMALLSLTGMVLMFFVKKKRVSGFTTAAVGTVVCYVVYRLWVP